MFLALPVKLWETEDYLKTFSLLQDCDIDDAKAEAACARSLDVE